MAIPVALNQTYDINIILNGGSPDTGVTYSVPSLYQNIISVNSSTGVVTPIATGLAIVEATTSGTEIRKVPIIVTEALQSSNVFLEKFVDSFPVATTNTAGLVKAGSGVTIASDGTLSTSGSSGGTGVSFDIGTLLRQEASPSGTWLKCDGSNYLKSSYPSLSSALGQLPAIPTWSQPQIGSVTQNNYGVAYGSGTYIRAASGFVETSTDYRSTWNIAALNTVFTGAIATLYANGLFLVGDSAGKLFSSADGVTWTSRTSNITSILTICYGAGLYIAAGSNGQLATSTDGTTWTSRTSGFSATTIRTCIYFGAGSVYIIGGDTGKISTSTDGTTWTSRTSAFSTGSLAVLGFATNGTDLVGVGASGKICTTTDGTTWTANATNNLLNNLNAVIYSGGTYVTGGANSTLGYSTDGGLTWTPIGTFLSTLSVIIYDGTNFVAFGGASGYMYSSDGITWHSKFLPSYTYVEYLNNIFVAIGPSGLISTSSDGITWTARGGGGNTAFTVAAYGSGTHIAGWNSTGIVYSSTDNLVTLTGHSTGLSAGITSAAYGAGLFVVTSAANSATSSDGVTWTLHTAPFYGITINKIVFLNNTFIAVGAFNKIFTSTDGLTWTNRFSDLESASNAVKFAAYGNGIYIIGANSGGLTVSTNATTWHARPINSLQNATVTFISIIFANGQFYAIGDTPDILYVSTDAVTWTQIGIPGLGYTTSYMGYGAGAFVVVGSGGLYLTGVEYPYNTSTSFRVPKIDLLDSIPAWIKAA